MTEKLVAAAIRVAIAQRALRRQEWLILLDIKGHSTVTRS